MFWDPKKHHSDKPTENSACAIFFEDGSDLKELSISYVLHNTAADGTCNYSPAGYERHKQYHFADVPYQNGSYQWTAASPLTGTSTRDVVHGINAAIAALKGLPVPTPFCFTVGSDGNVAKTDSDGRRMALMLLAHLVGDVHQPLHVGAIYLSKNLKPINPDETQTPKSEIFATRGANDLFGPCGSDNHVCSGEYHAQWDSVPKSAIPSSIAAKSEHNTPDKWASESVAKAADIFKGMEFKVHQTTPPHSTDDGFEEELISFSGGLDASERKTMQKEQITKAGQRLARILNDIWPSN